MTSYTISRLARLCGLARSTLLYYDRVGILPPRSRTSAGYRLYAEADLKRLERIRDLRQMGLSIEEIGSILRSEDESCAHLLKRRLIRIGEEILELKAKQRLLSTMLKGIDLEGGPPAVDKRMWKEMLQAAGMDERAMGRWHTEFEHRAPEAHHKFLLSLGIPEKEARMIRECSRKRGGGDGDNGLLP